MLDECNRRTTVLCMHEMFLFPNKVNSPRKASGSREKQRSRHGPRCGHTPLDIVS